MPYRKTYIEHLIVNTKWIHALSPQYFLVSPSEVHSQKNRARNGLRGTEAQPECLR